MKPEASPKLSLQAHFHVCLQRLLSSLHKVGAGLATEPLIAAGPDSACLYLQGILSHIEKCAGLGPLQPPAPQGGSPYGVGVGDRWMGWRGPGFPGMLSPVLRSHRSEDPRPACNPSLAYNEKGFLKPGLGTLQRG